MTGGHSSKKATEANQDNGKEMIETMEKISIDPDKPKELGKNKQSFVPSDEEEDREISASSTTSSVDTNEALLDMLGIDGDDYDFGDEDGDGPCFVTVDENIGDGEEDTCSVSTAPQSPQHNATPAIIIDLPSRCSRYLHPPSQCCAFVLPSILTSAECRSLIQKAAGYSFNYITEASHIDENGNSITVKLQNPNPHKLSVYHDEVFLEKVLWERLRPYVTAASSSDYGGGDSGGTCRGNAVNEFYKRTRCGPPIGLNPRVRVLRYDATDDDRFEPHFDATTRIDDQTSLLTVLVYLNDGNGVDFDGGETLYLDSHVSNLNTALDGSNHNGNKKSGSCTKISPRTGDVVIFEHDLYHSGAPLSSGTKYVMRTDIMFSADEVGVDSAAGCRRRRMDGAEEDSGGGGREDNGGGGNDALCEEDSGANGDGTPSTMVDFVQTVGLTEEETEYLDGMGILHVTPVTFLSPGVAAMRLMLRDGLQADKIDEILALAVDAVKNSN